MPLKKTFGLFSPIEPFTAGSGQRVRPSDSIYHILAYFSLSLPREARSLIFHGPKGRKCVNDMVSDMIVTAIQTILTGPVSSILCIPMSSAGKFLISTESGCST